MNHDLKSHTFLLYFRLGRKVAFIGSIVLYVGSNVSLSFAQEFWEFSALRLVSGVSVGGLITTCYVMGMCPNNEYFMNRQCMIQKLEVLIMYIICKTCNNLTYSSSSI